MIQFFEYFLSVQRFYIFVNISIILYTQMNDDIYYKI